VTVDIKEKHQFPRIRNRLYPLSLKSDDFKTDILIKFAPRSVVTDFY
jgi:hypothetical protein